MFFFETSAPGFLPVWISLAKNTNWSFTALGERGANIWINELMVDAN